MSHAAERLSASTIPGTVACFSECYRVSTHLHRFELLSTLDSPLHYVRTGYSVSLSLLIVPLALSFPQGCNGRHARSGATARSTLSITLFRLTIRSSFCSFALFHINLTFHAQRFDLSLYFNLVLYLCNLKTYIDVYVVGNVRLQSKSF